MATVTVPDRRDAANPNDVIDPTLRRDSTAGLQTAIDQAGTGGEIVVPFDVVANGGLILHGGRSLVLRKPDGTSSIVAAPVDYPCRVQPDKRQKIGNEPNPGYNPKGVCAPWLYDLTGSLSNPYCRKGADGKPNVTGGQFGNYDGSTGALDGSNNDRYDGKHLRTYISTPFGPDMVGLVARIIGSPYSDAEDFNVPIVRFVNPQRIEYNDPQKVSQAEGSTHTVAWCVEPKKGWGSVFMPNPSWKPEWVHDDWHAYSTLLRKTLAKNRGRTNVTVRAGCHLEGGELIGANDGHQSAISNFDASKPVVNEFQDTLMLETGSTMDGTKVHHAWGTGIDGPGKRENFEVDYCGRQSMVGHYDDLIAINGIIQGAKHTEIDFETGKSVSGVVLVDITIGGPHGISVHAPIGTLVLQRVHSTNADVAAGKIRQLAPLMAGTGGPSWGSSEQSHSISLLDCDFDLAQRNLLVVGNLDELHVHDTRGNVTGYLIVPGARADKRDRVKVIDVQRCEGGPQADGIVAP